MNLQVEGMVYGIFQTFILHPVEPLFWASQFGKLELVPPTYFPDEVTNVQQFVHNYKASEQQSPGLIPAR